MSSSIKINFFKEKFFILNTRNIAHFNEKVPITLLCSMYIIYDKKNCDELKIYCNTNHAWPLIDANFEFLWLLMTQNTAFFLSWKSRFYNMSKTASQKNSSILANSFTYVKLHSRL